MYVLIMPLKIEPHCLYHMLLITKAYKQSSKYINYSWERGESNSSIENRLNRGRGGEGWQGRWRKHAANTIHMYALPHKSLTGIKKTNLWLILPQLDNEAL